MATEKELLKDLRKWIDEYLEADEDVYRLQQIISELSKGGQSPSLSFSKEFDDAKQRVETALNNMRGIQEKLAKHITD
ncbi:MAG TPA: hypothetical protein G4O13_02630 [Dehalococcoidia bacterium]|nr:hypothetical protein [Dehalococcoidia bacterium]